MQITFNKFLNIFPCSFFFVFVLQTLSNEPRATDAGAWLGAAVAHFLCGANGGRVGRQGGSDRRQQMKRRSFIKWQMTRSARRLQLDSKETADDRVDNLCEKWKGRSKRQGVWSCQGVAVAEAATAWAAFNESWTGRKKYAEKQEKNPDIRINFQITKNTAQRAFTIRMKNFD